MSAVDTAAEIARRVPVAAVEALSRAAEDGEAGLRQLRAQMGASAVRHACDRLITHLYAGVDPQYLAGALAAACRTEQERRQSAVQIVWTGPDTGQARGRLTLATVTDLIASAHRELLLISYAAHSDPHLTQALDGAAARGVTITLLLERPQDNPGYEAWGLPFPALDATRLAWPAAERPAGAALHAKVLLVDDDVALIGSANLTSRAMESNLECGVVLRGHGAAHAIRGHINQLRARGVLQNVARPEDG